MEINAITGNVVVGGFGVNTDFIILNLLVIHIFLEAHAIMMQALNAQTQWGGIVITK